MSLAVSAFVRASPQATCRHCNEVSFVQHDVCVRAGYLQAPWASHQEVEDLVVKTSQRLGLSPYMHQLTRKFFCRNSPDLLHALLQSCALRQASRCHQTVWRAGETAMPQSGVKPSNPCIACQTLYQKHSWM